MKKILSVALVLLLSLSLFVGCGEQQQDDQQATSNLTNAKAFLENMIYGTNYNPGDVMTIAKNKEIIASVSVDGASYPIDWSIEITEGAADSVKIGEADTANHVAIILPEVAETDIFFSAIATIKGADGATEKVTFKYKMACTLGELEILDKAYGLADGEKVSGTPSLTGDIVEIKVPYDAASESITVVIQIGDLADKQIVCNGLKGDVIAYLVVGDNICVTGTLGKTAGVVGFEAGCTLKYATNVDGDPVTAPTTAPSGDNTTTTTVPSGTTATTTKPTTGTSTKLEKVTDEAKILKDIAKLGENEFLSYIAVLTGKVLQVEKYEEQYSSVTLTFKVGDTTLECYRMKGNGVDKVKAGDTITVQGVIKNYYYEGATKGKLEFAWHEASSTEVTMTKLVAAPTQDLSNEDKILEAALALKDGESLQKEVTLTGKVLDIETPYDESFGNITVNIRVKDVDIKCYRLSGTGVENIKAGDTITVKGTIKNYMGTIEFDTGCKMTKRVAGTNENKELSVVANPKAGVAYKFGMVQENVDKKAVYYLKGGMAQTYYLATSSSSSAAIDVYLEETTGGFYLYAMVNGSKLYINMVVNGTHVNGAYEATASTVYTYDAEAQTVIATVDGAPYWFGTRNDKSYTTVGPCKTEYEGFYCKFYA